MKKKFKATEIVVTISVKNSGASISRQVFENTWFLSDMMFGKVLRVCWEMLVILSYFHLIYRSLKTDWVMGLECITNFILTPVMPYVPLPQTFATG